MGYTKHAPGTTEDASEKWKRAQSFLAAYLEIVAGVDKDLAGPEDLRPKDGEAAQQRQQARGLPATFTRFNRPAFEQLREDLSRALEVAAQNTTAASRR
jgi:hypothetical protein